MFGKDLGGAAIGLLLTGYGIASLLGGPCIFSLFISSRSHNCMAAFYPKGFSAALVKNSTGSYDDFFYAMGGLEIIGFVCMLKVNRLECRIKEYAPVLA